MQRLELLKALGDNTRYAIYLEIARSASPRTTADIADVLGLHANTVRPHLERMRDVGLLEVEVDARGSVGRPQHRYCIATDAPSLGLEPPAFPALASMLAAVAAPLLPALDDVAEVGRAQGRAAAGVVARTASHTCVSALVELLSGLGFDPAADETGSSPVIGFAHCPYRELAEAYPQLVCQLHRGLVEGFVEAFPPGGSGDDDDAAMDVEWFHTLADRDPCQVGLSARYSST